MGHGSGPAHRMTCAERLELQRRVRAGETHAVAATALGCSAKSVQRLLVKTGGVKPRSTPPSALRLSLHNDGDDFSKVKQVRDGQWFVVFPTQHAPPGWKILAT